MPAGAGENRCCTKPLARQAQGRPKGQKLEALVGFRGVGSASCDQGGDERAKQGFAATACVVHELEEPEIERQLLLRDPPVRAEPGAQQGPEPLDGVDVHLAEPVPVLVAGILTPGMADCLMLIAPGGQAGIDAILVRMDEGAQGNGGGDDRPDRDLPHVGQHAQDHLPTPLDNAEDWGLVLFRRAPTRCALQLAAPPRSPLLATAVGWPLCPATTYTSSISTSPSSLASGVRATRPRRSCSVMACASDGLSFSSKAICRFERFRPIR